MAGERNSGGPFGGMPAPDLGEPPSRRSMDPERRRELGALVDATARRDPDAQKMHDAYRQKYNVPSVQENHRALMQRRIERERRFREKAILRPTKPQDSRLLFRLPP